MNKKSFYKVLISVLLVFSLTLTAFPPTEAYACKQDNHNQNHGNNNPKDKDKGKDSKDTSKYLVLAGQSNGTYLAYNDIAFVTADKYVMVKAKPLAMALGLTYNSNDWYWYKKGCSLTLGSKVNVYVKSKRTYYLYTYSNDMWQNSFRKYTADYKVTVYQNEYAVHCATLSTLLNYQYYDTSNVTAYSSLGYRGVVVYNQYSGISGLPDIKNTNLNNNNPNNNNNNNVTNVTVKPVSTSDPSYSVIHYVEATYITQQSNNTQLLDLSEVLNAFKAYSLPNDGVYGYGNCETAITLQGIDKNGYSVGEVKTNGGEFLLNFPNAVKLYVIGAQKNLIIDFMPVKPIVITSASKLAFNQIGWLFPYDHFARQYFVISENMRFYPENINSYFVTSRKLLDVNCKDNPDNANAYQRITAVFLSPNAELTSPNCFINVSKSSNFINNSLVIFSDTGNATLAADYETKLVSMIAAIKNCGLNSYYPSKNWDRQLVMKLSEDTVNTSYSYININAASVNLDYYYDYYTHLHEMAHFYEATQPHYGFRFETWIEGNATNLAKKSLDNLNIAHKDSNGNDLFDSLYATNYSFLTADNRKNFEAFYLNATGWNATVIGYHFTDFLQDTYGSDIVYRIMEKLYAANIPTGSGRNSTYDKQFTDCIKAVTSQNVFQLFVDYCVN